MKYKTVLITPGASGTYMLSDLVGINHLNNGILNFNRHRRNPDIKNCSHVIYLYSNPYDTILSYHRRGFTNDIMHCKHMEGDVNFLKKNLTDNLLSHLNLEIDPFNIKDHFMGYFNFDKRNYKIMFVKYENLDKHINEVLRWLNSEDKISNFFFKKRNSKWGNESEEVKILLKKRFGQHKEFLDKLPSIIYK